MSDWLRAKRRDIRGRKQTKGDKIQYCDYPPFLYHSSSAGSQKIPGVTDQAFFIHCSAENFVIHVLNIIISISSIDEFFHWGSGKISD